MSDVLTEAVEDEVQLTPGEIIAEMLEIRNEKTNIKKREKLLTESWRELEAKLMKIGKDLGMKRMASDVATATITEETLPMILDWDEVHKYIIENDACHVLQRRLSTAVYRELAAAGIEIPGTEPYIKESISLRKI